MPFEGDFKNADPQTEIQDYSCHYLHDSSVYFEHA